MSLDHYNKIKVVGKGSYGEVWLVTYRRDRKQYVLKKMEIQNASKREKKAAEQEAKLLSKLRHPNIVSYKDSFDSDDGHLYIVMGFCDGGDLYNRLKEQKNVPLEEKQVVEWFVQIAMALQYMHERNILHRDLKTQNIFLTKSKIIKVGDLGIARVLEGSNDMATTLIGTPYYMSPELFSNRPYNHKSDVWALGCCVYEMATLKHAFNARDMNSLVYKILRGKMPAMPQRYSNDLIELIKAMLQQSPEKRPSVARILRNPFIKKHIAIFLEGTRARRPSSSTSESARVKRGSKADVIETVKEESNRSRPSSAGDAKKSAKIPLKKKAASVSSSRPDSGPRRPDSGSKDGRPSSGGKERRVRQSGSEKPVTPRKARPLPTPPTQASGSTPRKSASTARKSAKSTSSVSSSASSSVSSSKGDSGTPLEEEGRRSVNRSARARRRADQLRESQEQGTPTGPIVSVGRRGSEPPALPHKSNTRESTDSGLGTDSVDGHVQKKTPVERTRSEPVSPSKQASNKRHESVEDSSSSDDEDEQNGEDKEIDEFSSLLETTLKLDKPSKGEGRDSPEDSSETSSSSRDSPDQSGMIAPPPSEMSSYGADPMNSTRDISIAPAAPRAPRGLSNATMTTSGRLMDRIAILRKDIIQGVGMKVLMKAYEILETEEDGDTEEPLVELMGRPKFELYGAKIWQLKFCEETVFG